MNLVMGDIEDVQIQCVNFLRTSRDTALGGEYIFEKLLSTLALHLWGPRQTAYSAHLCMDFPIQVAPGNQATVLIEA